MGFNSILYIPNDQLDEINRDPEHFARELTGAINLSCVEPKPTHLHGRFHDFTIPYCSHADAVGLVAVGGNHATKILHTGGRELEHHTDGGQIELLRLLADRLGYTVRKKKR